MGSNSEYVQRKKYKIAHTSNYNAFFPGNFASNTYKEVTMVMLPGSQMRWAYIQTTNNVDICEFVILRLLRSIEFASYGWIVVYAIGR